MLVKYTLTLKSLCPVDQMPDVYDVELTSDTTVLVEHIKDVVDSFSSMSATQEEIAVLLARELCCKVLLIGYHSGVKTEVWA